MTFKIFTRCNYLSNIGLAQSIAAGRYRISGSGSVGAAASSGASSNIPSSGTPTLTQVEAAALAIYASCISLGFSDAEAQAVAKAAALAYAAAIAQGLTAAQAASAAAAAAVTAAMAYVGNDGGLTDMLIALGDQAIYSAAFTAVLAQLPTSAQGAAQDAFLAYLESLGL